MVHRVTSIDSGEVISESLDASVCIAVTSDKDANPALNAAVGIQNATYIGECR